MLAPGKIYIGRPVRLTVSYAVDDIDSDPTAITLKVRDPCLVETDYTYAAAQVLKRSAGHYYCDVTPDKPGRWAYRWESAGTNLTDASEGNFLVQTSAFDDTWNCADSDYWIWP